MRPARAVLSLAWFTLSAGCSGEGCGDPHDLQGRDPVGSALPDESEEATVDARAGDGLGARRDAGSVGRAPLPGSAEEAAKGLHPSEPKPAVAARVRRCPADMVEVAGELCVDRYEAYLVDGDSTRVLSPFYHPTRARAQRSYDYWSAPNALTPDGLTEPDGLGASTPARARLLGSLSPAATPPELPVPPAWELSHELRPRAENRAGMRPQGYMSGVLARQACANAGKRLCREDEWVRACRGQLGRAYPYGPSHERGVCNVERESHPAAILHGNASIGHRDPRLNLVADASGPLLRSTGSSPRCKSEWGSDAIYDMVGNLDEWVDDPRGAFVGGFYSRQTRAGCGARVSAHPNEYFDYSLGVRCCKDARLTRPR